MKLIFGLKKRIGFTVTIFLWVLSSYANNLKTALSYSISMEDPSWHYFHVELSCNGFNQDSIDFKMPNWTPGYYQKMDYAKNVEGFKAIIENDKELKWIKVNDNTWRVYTSRNIRFKLKYEIKTTKVFVANPYLDENRAYILPAGVFLYIKDLIQHPVQLIVKPFYKWSSIATGLDSVLGKKNTYTAPDFDILYDCPVLAGNLEELKSFSVNGIKHRFIGYKLGDFDKAQLMIDLKRIVEASIKLMGPLPYKQYTFIAIGPGAGGIEHLNNTTFGFNSNGMWVRDNYLRTLNFLAHEYFHHNNVKRIRPIELGPFDYDKGSRTKQLWVSEGLSVYYEYLLVKRAGISTTEELLKFLQKNIAAFENKSGKLYQTLEQASWETWSDGPFGRTNDPINKTISYYDKGPAVGWLLDLKIRQSTKNKKSLDDVMRFLYKEFYLKKKRGFNADEFRSVCESIAGTSLQKEFEYVTTTNELDYNTYLSYAGLEADTLLHEIPGVYLGFKTRMQNDSIQITSVDLESAAWNAGIRSGQKILEINGQKATQSYFDNLNSSISSGYKIRFKIFDSGKITDIEITAVKKSEKNFNISLKENPSKEQKQIFESWLKG